MLQSTGDTPMNITEQAKKLGISRQHYYRLKKSGKLEEKQQESLKTVQQNELIFDWCQANQLGIGTTIWTEGYQTRMTRLLELYFKQYETVTPENVQAWLAEV